MGDASKESQAVEVSVDESRDVKKYVYVDPNCAPDQVSNISYLNDSRVGRMPPVRQKKLHEKVLEEMRNSEHLYVHDFFVMSSPKVPIRIITDDPATALMVRNLVPSPKVDEVQGLSDVVDFSSSASVLFHSSKFDISQSGLKFQVPEVWVYNAETNQVLVAGTQNKSAIVDGITTLVAGVVQHSSMYDDMQPYKPLPGSHPDQVKAEEHQYELLKTARANRMDEFVVRCDTLTNTQDGSVTAVFGHSLTSQCGGKVTGSHAHVVFVGKDDRSFINPIFEGGSHLGNAQPSAGDLVENVTVANKKFKRVTAWPHKQTNITATAEQKQVKTMLASELKNPQENGVGELVQLLNTLKASLQLTPVALRGDACSQDVLQSICEGLVTGGEAAWATKVKDLVAATQGLDAKVTALERAVHEYRNFVKERLEMWDANVAAPSCVLGQWKRAVFVVNDESKVLPTLSKLRGDQIGHHFFFGNNQGPCFSSHLTEPVTLTKSFVSAVEKLGVSVYLVNASSAGANLNSILESLSNEAKSTFNPNKLTNLNVCSELNGIKKSALTYSTTASKVKKFASKRSELLMSQHVVLPDSILKGSFQ